MSLTLEQVEHIAALARLELTAEEKTKFQEQLSSILEFADQLQELDTESIPPTASVLPLHTVFRPDEVMPSLSRDELFRNAPDTEAGSFRVPPVLDNK